MDNKKIRRKWENREAYDESNNSMTEDDLLEFYEWSNDNGNIDDIFKNIKIDDDDYN